MASHPVLTKQTRRSKYQLRNQVLQYYQLIDAGKIDQVLQLFSETASYWRCETEFHGIAAIANFYQNDRKITGHHNIQNLWVVSQTGIVQGTFIGQGEDHQPKRVGFADFFRFNESGKIQERHTYLSLGSRYVKE